MTVTAGSIGYVTTDGSLGNWLCFTNDAGGTSELPAGTYRVCVTRSFYDYEVGTRVIGTLVDDEDLATARRAGTTGYRTDPNPYRPSTVYFTADQFVPEEVFEARSRGRCEDAPCCGHRRCGFGPGVPGYGSMVGGLPYYGED